MNSLSCEQVARAAMGHPLSRSGKELLWRCPFHSPDKHPSFQVNTQKDCWLCGPCGKSGDGWDLAAALAGVGLEDRRGIAAWLKTHGLSDGFRPSSRVDSPIANRKPVTVAELAAAKKLPLEFLKKFGLQDSSDGIVIPYHLADASLAPRQRVRRSLEHDGRWCWWTGKGSIVPYGLQRLADARKAGFLVLVEGESDRWTLSYHGFSCLGIPGAEMAKTLSADHLQGIPKAFIVQESDAAGARFSASLIKHLREIGWTGETRILTLGQFKDVSALHCADPGKFKAVFQAALDSAALPDFQALPAASGGFTLTRLGELLAKPDEPVDWVLENRLAAGTVSVAVAKPKVGKSTFARNLCLAIARGEEFLGSAVKQGECVYLALEEREQDVRDDFRAMGATGAEPIWIHAAAVPAEGMKALADLMRERKPVLVVIDPLFRLARVRDESAYAETYAALGPMIDLARETGTHVMLLHHSGKSAKSDAIDAPLGSTAIGGAVSTLIVLKRTEAYRTLQTVQRIGPDLEETVLNFDPESRRLSVGGTRAEADRAQCEAAILEFLESVADSKTEMEIKEAVEGNNRVTQNALRELVKSEQVVRSGTGKKGNPYAYSKNAHFLTSGISKSEEVRIQKVSDTRMNTSPILTSENSEKPILTFGQELSLEPAFSGPESEPERPVENSIDDDLEKLFSEPDEVTI